MILWKIYLTLPLPPQPHIYQAGGFFRGFVIVWHDGAATDMAVTGRRGAALGTAMAGHSGAPLCTAVTGDRGAAPNTAVAGSSGAGGRGVPQRNSLLLSRDCRLGVGLLDQP